MGTKKQTLRNRLLAFAVVMVYALALLPSFALAANTHLNTSGASATNSGTVVVDNSTDDIVVEVPFGTEETVVTLVVNSGAKIKDGETLKTSDTTFTLTGITTTEQTANLVIVDSSNTNDETYAVKYKQTPAQTETNLSKVKIAAFTDSAAVTGSDVEKTTFAAGGDTVDMPYVIDNVKVTPTLASDSDKATIKVNGETVASAGTTTEKIALSAGITTKIDVVVTPQSGAAKTYTFNVTRAAGSSDATISTFSAKAGSDTFIGANSDSPVVEFKADQENYSVNVPTNVTAITLAGTVKDGEFDKAKTEIHINGTKQSELSDENISGTLNLISNYTNVVTAKIVSQNGAEKTYTFKFVVGAQENDSNLKGLEVQLTGDKDGTVIPVSPAFSAGNKYYTANIGNAVNNVWIKATPNADSAKVNIKGVDVADATKFTEVTPLANVQQVPVKVTAQDGTVSTYYITFTKLAPSDDASVKDIAFEGAWSDQAFNPTVVNYTGQAADKDAKIVVTPTSPYAKVKVNGADVVNGKAQPIVLSPTGETTFTVEVTSEDTKNTKKYTYKLSINKTFMPPVYTKVTEVTETTMTVTYDEPKNMTHYALYYKVANDADAKWMYGAQAKSGAGKMTVKGLVPGTTYDFVVTPGIVLYGTKVSYMPLSGFTPKQATTLVWNTNSDAFPIIAADATSITVGVIPVSGAESYALYYKDANDANGKWMYGAKGNAKVANLTAKNLDAKKTYVFKITSGKMFNGKMSYVPLLDVGTSDATKLNSTGLPVIKTVTEGTASALVEYTGVSSAVDYAVYIAETETGKYTYAAKTANPSEMTIKNLEPGKTYFIKLTPGKKVGNKVAYTALKDITAKQIDTLALRA